MVGLRRHIPELAIEWALDEPGRLWRAIDGTLCFADISGFTALSEKLSRRGRIGGEELVETLSRVFGGMLDSAAERDGMLLKFGGDALLFLFEGDDHALRAASTAVEMRQALRRAKEIPTSVGPLDLSMSVGLHSGTIHFFLVGSTHRELVLAGRDASTAAAIESAANAGEIGLSLEAASRLPASAVRAREDGLLLLRWRKAPNPPAGASPRRDAGDEVLRGLFPQALGEVLGRGAPEPEHRIACIAFVRFSGTDSMLERSGPGAVAEALDATIGTAQRIFATEDITLLAVDIDKDGGKLFLGSGVPHGSEDDEGRMLRALRRLADAHTPLPLQLGVNRGHVFAAEVGTRRRAAYSAMGDTTNTAARICAKAPAGGIYAHPSVLTHSRTKYLTEAVGPFTFKGKKAPQVLYRVGEETRTVPASRAHAAPLVGRVEEFRVLAEALDGLGRGTGGVVSVTAAAGLGKSRLLKAALDRWQGETRPLHLHAEAYGTTSPYRVFRDPLRALLGIGAGDASSRRPQLEAAIRERVPSLLPLLALIGEVVQVEVPPSAEVGAIEPRFRQDRVADAVIELLAADHPGPRVIIMEHAQWADGASTHLLNRLARACGERPWLLLVTRRPEEGGFSPADGRSLDLAPLDESEIKELINRVTGSAPLRPHELDLVAGRAGGNPLYAEELVRAARAVGSFEAVPDSLEAAMAARVDALDPEARRVLRYATVLGRSFSRRNLAALLQAEGLELDDAVFARLEGFLEAADHGEFIFRPALLRRTVYEGLAYRLRTRLHRHAGELMERFAADPSSKADSLALHFSIAGDHERAWRYARIAADRAARAYANADAARLYQMALEAGHSLPNADAAELVQLWTDHGNVCLLAGFFEHGLEAFRAASRLVGDDPVRRAELLRHQAVAHERAGAFRLALGDLSRGARLLADVHSPAALTTRARLSSYAAMIRFAQERYRDALRQGVAATEMARHAGDREALAQALVAAASAELFLGSGGSARMKEALRIYEELGDLSKVAMARGNIGACTFMEGRWDEALSWLKGARDAELRAGNHVGAATADANRGEIFAKQGRVDQAEPILREAVRVMRASGFHDGAAYTEIQLGRALLGLGATREADELLERVGAELARYGRKSSVLEAAIVRSIARLRLGDPAGALDLVDQATAAATDPIDLLEPQLADARALALAALGRDAEAQKQLAQGLAAARKHALCYEEGMLLRRRASLHAAAGRTPDREDVKRSSEILGALGVRKRPNAPARAT